MDYVEALLGAPFLPQELALREGAGAAPTGEPAPAPAEEESLRALCERMDKLNSHDVTSSDLKRVRERIRAEREAGSDVAHIARLQRICDRLEKPAPVSEGSGIIRHGDPRLKLRLSGLNGLEAMEAMIQEMGYKLETETSEGSQLEDSA